MPRSGNLPAGSGGSAGDEGACDPHRGRVVGVLTALSSFTFWGLKSNDGDNVSNRRARETRRMQDPPVNVG